MSTASTAFVVSIVPDTSSVSEGVASDMVIFAVPPVLATSSPEKEALLIAAEELATISSVFMNIPLK